MPDWNWSRPVSGLMMNKPSKPIEPPAYGLTATPRPRAFVPFFLTQFSFILAMNIFGLIWLPGGLAATATANLAVTAGMAITTLLVIHLSGIKQHGFFHHWKNFLPHGLPWFVLPIIIPVEIIGIIVKPAAAAGAAAAPAGGAPAAGAAPAAGGKPAAGAPAKAAAPAAKPAAKK